jgi:hypothetical protein
MVAPTPNAATGGVGEHTTVAPGGKPPTVQVAFAATLGPLLKHVIVPVTVLPAGGLVGNPVIAACMSARGAIVIGALTTLLAGVGSAVFDVAVVEILSGPAPGAMNVDTHSMMPFSGNGSGTGLGVQVCTAPGGNPDNAQLAPTAPLGPAFVQVPLTVMFSPALAVAGALIAATISARGDTVVAACAVLLPAVGSGFAEPATPVMVIAPSAGTV